MLLSERFPLKQFLHADAAPGIDLLKAGRLDAAYRCAAANLNWYELLTSCPGAIDAFRRSIARMGYQYCIVDSRTGLSDASGICTALMPDKLVAMYTPNRQNLDGLKLMVRRAVEDRREANDLRPLAVFPVASRIENSEGDLKAVWTLTFLNAFENLFSELYGEKFDLAKYFEDVQLPYVSQYAYGERVAVVEEERSDAFSLRRAYEVLTGYLERDRAWPEPEE